MIGAAFLEVESAQRDEGVAKRSRAFYIMAFLSCMWMSFVAIGSICPDLRYDTGNMLRRLSQSSMRGASDASMIKTLSSANDLLNRGYYSSAALQFHNIATQAASDLTSDVEANARLGYAKALLSQYKTASAKDELDRMISSLVVGSNIHTATLQCLGTVQREMGHLQASIDTFQNAEALAAKAGDATLIPSLLAERAESLWRRGDAAGAQRVANSAMRLHRDLNLPRSDSVLIYTVLGRAAYSLGNVTRSMELLQDAAQFHGSVWQGRPDIVLLQFDIALNYRDFADMDAGLRVLESLEKVLREGPNEGPELAYVLERKAVFLREMDEHEGAWNAINEAKRLIGSFGGDANPRTALTLNTYGSLLKDRGLLHEAARSHQHALQINLDTGGASYRRTASTYNNLGLVHLALHNTKAAEKYLTESLRITLATSGHSSPDSGIMHGNVAEVKLMCGKAGEAVELLKERLRILDVAGLPKQSVHWRSMAASLSRAKQIWRQQEQDEHTENS